MLYEVEKSLNEHSTTLPCLCSRNGNSLSCIKGKVAFKNPLSVLESGSKSVFCNRLVMLTAGHKLTSSVDPKRDAVVALRQVRTFKAVFVLEPSVGRLFWR